MRKTFVFEKKKLQELSGIVNSTIKLQIHATLVHDKAQILHKKNWTGNKCTDAGFS